MITLQRPDPKLIAFLGANKGINDGDMIKPSLFAVALNIGERHLVMNMLTGQCIESRYFEWFENPEERSYNEDDCEMNALVKRDFLVSTKVDEVSRYLNLIGLLRRLERPAKEGYTGYTILPTTACNARCIYCYQEGIEYESMDDEVLEHTIKYIHRTRRPGAMIRLRWFGGEPLMGEKAIDRICEAMREKGVRYNSSMISNGSLMTEKMAEKAKKQWHLRNIQITLDGREAVYCERKCYPSFEGSPYRAVLDGIHALLKRDIRVSIRLNVDENNLEEMNALIDELENEFEGKGNISIYSHGIFAESEEEAEKNADALYDGMEMLNERLYRFNRNRGGASKKKVKRKYYDRRFTAKRYFCMADNPPTGPVIVPNGNLHLCEHIGDRPVVGTVFDTGIVDKDKFVERGRENKEKCVSCPFFPRCTDFTGCPTIDRDCYRERKAVEIRNLRSLEKAKRLPPVTISHDGKIIRVTEPTAEFAERCTPILADDFLKADMTVNQDEAERLLNS